MRSLILSIAFILAAGSTALADPISLGVAGIAFAAGAPVVVVNGLAGVGLLGSVFSVAGSLALSTAAPFVERLRSVGSAP